MVLVFIQKAPTRTDKMQTWKVMNLSDEFRRAWEQYSVPKWSARLLARKQPSYL